MDQSQATELKVAVFLAEYDANVRKEASKLARDGLPTSMEFDDLLQVGREWVIKSGEALDYHAGPQATAYITGSLRAHLVQQINIVRFGVANPTQEKDQFRVISAETLVGDSELSIEDVLGPAEERDPQDWVPQDPARREEIYFECAKKLAEIGRRGAYKSVSNIAKKQGGGYVVEITLLGKRTNLSGFANVQEAAKAKWDVYTKIQQSVLPLIPRSAKGALSKRIGSKTRFARLTSKRLRMAVSGRALPEFFYWNPLAVMLVLERLCLANTTDWTEPVRG